MDYDHWDNLSSIVYKRTYSREDTGVLENWSDTVKRAIRGNIRNHNVPEKEINQLQEVMLKRKGTPAGRGLWFSGSPSHDTLGGAALNNCWFVTADDWYNFVIAQDLLMLGGGVGMSVEHRFTSKLPEVKTGVEIYHEYTKDADFIVPDSREGWCDLLRKVLKAFFVTSRSFSYSTVCVRGRDLPIKGFGGKASGPMPLVAFVEKLCGILLARQGRHIRPIDAMDILCCTGEMVVSGNVRRSAILIMGDCWDREYLTAKRWDLKEIPTERSCANLSVVCDDIEDLHPSFWKTYEHGEPFGIVNRKNIQQYGRMGEKLKDTAMGVNPCVPSETEILTDKGYQSIISLVGKSINIWNGFAWSKVTPQITGYNQPLIKVTFNCGRSLVSTPYHEYVIREGFSQKGTIKKVRAQDLIIGDRLEKFSFPIIKGGVDVKTAYRQGFYEGDGNTTHDRKTIKLYGEKAKLAKEFANTKRVFDNYTTVALGFEPMPKGFVPNGWSVASRLDWLAGLFDSDGTITKDGGVQVTSTNKSLLLNVQKLLTTLGCSSKVINSRPARVQDMPGGRYNCKATYRVLIGAVQIYELNKLGLNTKRLNTSVSPNRDATRFSKVVSIENLDKKEDVYCFTEPLRGLGCFEGIVTGNCAEANLENGEPCNLQEIPLPRIKDRKEFGEVARLMHRYGKRVCAEHYHHELTQEVVSRNARVGTGITGCLQSSLFNPDDLNYAYQEIQKENVLSSKEYGLPLSIRTTLVKPSGTLSKVFSCFPGIHAGYAPYVLLRIRFSSNDKLLPLLRAAGHPIEYELKFDGSRNSQTSVVSFYTQSSGPTAKDFDTWQQLDTLLMAQKYWADQAVSVTVYYKKKDIPRIKEWLTENLKNLKTISFLCHDDHGFAQAPLEEITEEEFTKQTAKLKPVDLSSLRETEIIDGLECEGGVCPVR